MNDDLVERVAKTMAEEKLWAGVWEHMPDAERETFRPLAFVAISVVLEEAAKVAENKANKLAQHKDVASALQAATAEDIAEEIRTLKI